MRSFQDFFPSWSHILPRAKVIWDTGRHHDPHESPAWRALYVAALFETDKERMVQKIAIAKTALVVRARELFHTTGDHLQEQTAIDEAFQALHALEQCTGHLCVQRR